MIFPAQKTFDDFTRERFGPNWVYGRSKNQESFARNGERQTVITKKEQRQLHADYKREWGEEHNLPAWKALCALRCAKRELDVIGETHMSDSYNCIYEAIEVLTS